MDTSENDLSFVVLYGSREFRLSLSPYDTVLKLKHKIYEKFDVPLTKQVIDCWSKTPKDDTVTLDECSEEGTNYLVLYNEDNLTEVKQEICGEELMEEDDNFRELESCASLDFIEYFSSNFDDRGILFHVCRLEDALSQACFTSVEGRKILLLYFHNKTNKFAKIFGENLNRPEVKELVNDRFFLLGWDLEKEEYHPALIDALSSRAELSALVNFVESKVCAALLIVPIKNSFTLFSCMKSKVSKKDFLETLKKADEFLVTENEIEKDLENVEQSESDIGSISYQQIMLDLLGDRDYDSFDHFEFQQLKDKIGYALYGPPQSETGYDEKQTKKIQSLFEVIVKENNIFTKWKDRIIISFVYNCTEPLPSEKQKRAKKFKDYNPTTDLNPIPLFILRKCKNSENPCRVIIDDTGRVYKTWNEYLTKNKLPSCEMVLPLNGRYQADENGNVILERHLSPACGIDAKILQGADIANTAVGLVSGGIFIAAAIPTITVAPVALIVAGATGLGVGLYSLGRSAYTLYDRNKYKESLSFANSEARGAYLNMVAGSLGFVGVGASLAVSQLATAGFSLGQGANQAVNVINVANLGATGINVVNSSYDVFEQWWKENKTPSLLTLVQLSSSILFFGHALYSFKTAGTMIEESQAQTLREYHDNLRSNRHRKAFNKLLKETIKENQGDVVKGQSEVIKTIVKIQNKDEVFAALTRVNKRMSKNGVKFMADDGDIKLNGVNIDMGKLDALDNSELPSFLTPKVPEPSENGVRRLNSQLKVSFRGINAQEIGGLALSLWRIFSNTEETIKDRIINAVANVVMKLMDVYPGCFRELDKMFPGIDKFLRLFTMVSGFFQDIINKIEEQYQKWLATKDPSFEEPYFPRLALDFSKRIIEIFHFVSEAYFVGNNLTEKGLRELITHFHTWFTKQEIEFESYMQRKQERIIHSSSPSRRAKCPDCGGVYYH